jgi:hypothetical protein
LEVGLLRIAINVTELRFAANAGVVGGAGELSEFQVRGL